MSRFKRGLHDQSHISGNAIGFAPEVDANEGDGYILSGASWSDSRDNVWHGSFDSGERSSSVTPLSSGQKLRLGIVNVPGSEDAPGRAHVVWFECLGEPSEIDDS